MTNPHSLQNHSTPPTSKPARIDNLIKNADFSAGFEHWAVTDFGNPDNCTIQGHIAVLKNNGSIVQSVDVERAAPYTLRFDAFAPGGASGIAQVLEDGVITQTIYVPGGHYHHSFVTRETTTVANIQFTGIGENQFFVYDILLTKDLPDPEELVKNGDFDFGDESWQRSGDVRIYDGRCEIHNTRSTAYQPITGLVPGATYRISCTTLALDPFYFGAVYVSASTGRIEVITLREGVHEYAYDYQLTDTSLTLYLEGFTAAYDSVSIKRISV